MGQRLVLKGTSARHRIKFKFRPRSAAPMCDYSLEVHRRMPRWLRPCYVGEGRSANVCRDSQPSSRTAHSCLRPGAVLGLGSRTGGLGTVVLRGQPHMPLDAAASSMSATQGCGWSPREARTRVPVRRASYGRGAPRARRQHMCTGSEELIYRRCGLVV